MAGGLLNIVAVGNQNTILTGNPTKTLFKFVYSKYTNFGLQKFRIDYKGLRTLNLDTESNFTFKIPRYAELLLDTYVVVTIPNIWSPIYPPQTDSDIWVPYEFSWIENLGAQMIKEVTITCGNTTIQKFSGSYIHALVQRDFSSNQRNLFNEMTGNTENLNNPAKNEGSYPNAYYRGDNSNLEPSIRGRNLYIPISAWYTFSSKMAIPLVALQYNELTINITMRPIKELFIIRDVTDVHKLYPKTQPNFVDKAQQLFNFLQPPPNTDLDYSNEDTRNTWDTDVHLLATYAFLSEEETKCFASREQEFLIKNIREYNFFNVVGSKRLELETNGLVSSWMFFFRRNDAFLRNQWSNYSNWAYDKKPYPASLAASQNLAETMDGYTPDRNPDGRRTDLFVTNNNMQDNQKEILMDMAILIDGKYRENLLESGVFNYVEKYESSKGSNSEGLYCYNFCLNTSPYDLQPSGAMNLSKFSRIELEVTTFLPPQNPNAQFLTICNEEGEIIGVNKPTWRLYDYGYDMYLFEERYNVLTFVSGNCGLMFAQ